MCRSGATLEAKRSRETPSGENPDATALSSASGGEALLQGSSLPPEESAALGLFPGSKGRRRPPPTVTTLEPEAEAELSAPSPPAAL